MSSLRLGRRVLASPDHGAAGEALYQQQRAKGVGTALASNRMGEKIMHSERFDDRGRRKASAPATTNPDAKLVDETTGKRPPAKAAAKAAAPTKRKGK